jgi:hypothetical protein
MSPTADATWLAAQDTAAECTAIGTAFGLAVAPFVAGYTYACAEEYGNHGGGPAPVGGTWYCSNYGSCPAQHRGNADGLGNACAVNTYISICPCE